ncbi:putative nuclease HARBI1 [Calliphora vicina]|uniref:putative nuclease HARBI1 n=1 Tax=Calliphora vicina TaxID=7373 RepID=UPI00325B860C
MFRIGALILLQEEEEIQQQRIVRRDLRDSSNPLEMPDTLFIQHYRVNKAAFTYILDTLTNFLPAAKKSFGIPPIIKLSACLRFFAEGGYQKGVGRDYEVGMAQSTISEVLSKVLDVLEQSLCDQWITYPSEDEKRVTSQEFYRKFGIPGIVGCIDGTHINIVAPNKNNHLYYNRKGNYSLNATLICDSKMRIRFVDATHPGACHDSFVWSTSSYRRTMQEDYLRRGSRVWLLGKMYPLEPWLLTPYRTPASASIEQKFNDVHSKCRNIIERTNGVLKNRWRCLLGARELHYEPKKAVKIINVCVALHNICIAYKCEYNNSIISDLEETELFILESGNTTERERYLASAQRIRSNIANSL